MSTRHILFGAVIGAAIGFVVGEILADKFAPEYYTEEELEELLRENEEILDENEYREVKEISEIREEMKMNRNKRDYGKFYRSDAKGDLTTLAAKHKSRAEEYIEEEEVLYGDESEEPEGILDGKDLVDDRDKSNIYIMTREEWESNETGYTQVSLNYYPDDDVLTDSKGRPLPSAERLVGPDALTNFGTFSDDPHVVFVCNPKTNAEYEILMQDGAYSDVIPVRAKAEKKPKKGVKNTVVVHNIFEDAAREDKEAEEGDG